MHIAILKCDTVREPFAAEYGQYPYMFANLLHAVDSTIELSVYDIEAGQFPADIDAADAYLITGSRHGVYDGFVWITQLEEFVRALHQRQKKLIGICFGHQLIAQALGGTVLKSPKGWGVGMSTNKLLVHKPWMHYRPEQFNLLVSHQDQVVSLPQDAEVLAGSDFCPYYLLQIGDHILTIQGHPEFTKPYSRALITSREDRLTANEFRQGLNSLELAEDDQLIAQWLVSFCQSE